MPYARRAVDMQESSIWGVHQTHSATRDDDGSGGKRDQTESQEAGENTRVHTLSCTNSLGARGQARGGRASSTSHRGCAAQEPTAPLSMQGMRKRRQTRRKCRAEGERVPRGGMQEGNAQGKRPASPLQDNSTKADGGLKIDEAGAFAAKNATVVSRLQNLEAALHGVTNNGIHTCTNMRARKHTQTHTNTHTHTHTHTHSHTTHRYAGITTDNSVGGGHWHSCLSAGNDCATSICDRASVRCIDGV